MINRLIVSSSPHVKTEDDTRSIMLDVCIALLFPLGMAVYLYGPRVIILSLASVTACVAFEALYCKLIGRKNPVGDFSAVVTGLLLAFNVPVTAPYWMIIVGDFFAIVIVKQLYGGLGKNFMNPALAARAFLILAWPVAMTTWTVTGGPYAGLFGNPDAVSAATPLSMLKTGAVPTHIAIQDMLFGQKSGCIGEGSSIVLILCFLYLVVRRVISPRIPLCYVGTVAVLTFLFPRGGADPLTFMTYELLSGGLLLGAVFMATDYTTSPVTPRGQIMFGIGCGLLTVLIRYFGSLPEGVMYSILIMNTCVWLFDKLGRPRRFGGGLRTRLFGGGGRT